MKALRPAETSGTAKLTTRCHVPSHVSPQQYLCENLHLATSTKLSAASGVKYVYFHTDSLSYMYMASYGLFRDNRSNKFEFLENIELKPDFHN